MSFGYNETHFLYREKPAFHILHLREGKLCSKPRCPQSRKNHQPPNLGGLVELSV